MAVISKSLDHAAVAFVVVFEAGNIGALAKLRARTPPALHHCLAEAVVINFCPAGVSRQFFMHRQSASRCCYAEPPFQSASGAGSTVAGLRHKPYACALSPRAVCTLCRSVLATPFDPSNDQGLSDGLRFSLHTLVCGSWACVVVQRSAVATIA